MSMQRRATMADYEPISEKQFWRVIEDYGPEDGRPVAGLCFPTPDRRTFCFTAGGTYYIHREAAAWIKCRAG